jgi:two-component system OmpR family response regulator
MISRIDKGSYAIGSADGAAYVGRPEHSAIDADDATQRRILLIDDEPNILRFLSRALRGHGFHVDCAADGLRGLEMMRSGDYGLLVLDLVMPGVDGISTLKTIMAATPDQPVMVLSALTDVESKVRCLELGAADYVTKPFLLQELLARVRARLRQPSSPATKLFISAGRVRLDLQRHVADAGSGDVQLSAREFVLLLYLMQRAGTVCAREQLLAEVWDTPFDPHTNVVDVYVRRLRRKLGANTIETFRNVGYALRVA